MVRVLVYIMILPVTVVSTGVMVSVFMRMLGGWNVTTLRVLLVLNGILWLALYENSADFYIIH